MRWLPLFLLASVSAFGMPELKKLKLPTGYRIDLFATGVENARQMAWSESGRVLYVGSRGEGKVYAITDTDLDRKGDSVRVIAEGLNMPSGIALHKGDLYIAAVSKVLVIKGVDTKLKAKKKGTLDLQTVYAGLPGDRHHGWKYLGFGPDGALYIPVGAPCNICQLSGVYGKILRMKPLGAKPTVFATGVRNSVGFDWNPRNGVLWFTENGRDWMGDDVPNDELNRAPKVGLHFGYPYCHAGKWIDDEEGDAKKYPCSKFASPAQRMGAHVAPLGMKFHRGKMFPPADRNWIYIAEHGSWNRSTKVGYRVVRVRVEVGKAKAYEPFVTGWLNGDEVWGRPSDILFLPDGSMLIADDYKDAVYRVSYSHPSK
jgi:glucose/arabinose dehydrogenase